jgi:hypothetical protein
VKLQEGIDHLKELLAEDNFGCEECRNDHEQLLMWLLELSLYRQCLNIHDEDAPDMKNVDSNDFMIDKSLFDRLYNNINNNTEESKYDY